MIKETDKLILTTRRSSGKYSVEHSFDRLSKRIDEYNNRRKKRRLLWWKVSIAAASVAILALCGTFFLRSSATEEVYVLNAG
ncbi:MAG: hypothetical protein LBT24_00240, partial [Tannerella sp.]|nr:hypothetical protein [Tannerella sp.]